MRGCKEALLRASGVQPSGKALRLISKAELEKLLFCKKITRFTIGEMFNLPNPLQ